jgi:hypothetical protein
MLAPMWMRRRLCVLLLSIGGLGGTSCGPSESSLRQEIDQANHCQVASDCADAGSVCPFGCNILVHKDEVAAIRARLRAYEMGGGSRCAYDCRALQSIQCTAGRCVGVYQ